MKKKRGVTTTRRSQLAQQNLFVPSIKVVMFDWLKLVFRPGEVVDYSEEQYRPPNQNQKWKPAVIKDLTQSTSHHGRHQHYILHITCWKITFSAGRKVHSYIYRRIHSFGKGERSFSELG